MPDSTDTALTAAAACHAVLSRADRVTAGGSGGQPTERVTTGAPGSRVLIDVSLFDHMRMVREDLEEACSTVAHALAPAGHDSHPDAPAGLDTPASVAAAYQFLRANHDLLPDYADVAAMADRHRRAGLILTARATGRSIRICPCCTRHTVVPDTTDDDHLVCVNASCDPTPATPRTWSISGREWQQALVEMAAGRALGEVTVRAIAGFYGEPEQTWRTRIRRAGLAAARTISGVKYYRLQSLTALAPPA